MRLSFLSLLALAAPVLMAPLAGCSDFLGFQTLPTYRYEVVVEVDTPRGLRQGSSVIQVETHRGPGWTPDKYATSWKFSGDAVTIDLGGPSKIFVVFRVGQGSYYWPQETMLSFIHLPYQYLVDQKNTRLYEIKYIWNLRGWHCVVGCIGEKDFARMFSGAAPLLVTFSDQHNPSTLRVLDRHHLDREFGQGVKLRDIKVRVTRSPVTRTIAKSLPWLDDMLAVSRIPLQPPGSTRDFVDKLDRNDFTRED